MSENIKEIDESLIAIASDKIEESKSSNMQMSVMLYYKRRKRYLKSARLHRKEIRWSSG